MKKFQKAQKDKGFTLFAAIVTAGILLLIATGVASLAVRQSLISSSGRQSQHAFYAADTGIECALYWDVKNPAGFSAFSTTTGSNIYCNKDLDNLGNEWAVGGSDTSTFGPITFEPEVYCTVVTVTKEDDGSTEIESRGYNTCDLTNPRRVERAIRATY